MHDAFYPEEEAYLTHTHWLILIEQDGKEYADVWLKEKNSYMHENVFEYREDHMRYDAALAKLLNGARS